PISRSAMTVVHSNLVLPIKQYQCGKKFTDSNARELHQANAVAPNRAASPSFSTRGEKPRGSERNDAAPADTNDILSARKQRALSRFVVKGFAASIARSCGAIANSEKFART